VYRKNFFATPFDANMQVKALVAACYRRDGKDLVRLFLMGLKGWPSNRSYRSKLFITLRTAIECYLKALVIIYSDKAESPEDAYNVVRNLSHRLSSLLEEVQNRSKWKKKYFRKVTEDLITQVNEMKVGLRYELDMAAAFSKCGLLMSGTIVSDEWMSLLLEQTRYIGKRADKAFGQRMSRYHGTFGGVDKRALRIKQFIENVKL
jgi:hypothetical protein